MPKFTTEMKGKFFPGDTFAFTPDDVQKNIIRVTKPDGKVFYVHSEDIKRVHRLMYCLEAQKDLGEEIKTLTRNNL